MSSQTFQPPLTDRAARPSRESSAPTTGRARQRAWRIALILPLLLAGPWLWLWSLPGLTNQAAWTEQIGTPRGMILVLLLAVTTLTDLAWKRIPNWATYSALLWAVLLNASCSLFVATADWEAWGGIGLVRSLAGASVLLLTTFLLYVFTGTGAGDVKLAAAIGALLGMEQGLEALAYSFICAGATVLCWAVLTRGPLEVGEAFLRQLASALMPRRVGRPSETQVNMLRSPIPLAPFFAIGTMLVLFEIRPELWFAAL